MTREFLTALELEFPEKPSESREGYMHRQFNFEQFAVAKKGSWKSPPSLESITQIAKTTLKRVTKIRVLESDIEVVQGLGKGDILIIPGYQSSKTAHVIGITDLDIDVLRVFFSTSWHSNYHMTPKQIERYVSFAKEYFTTFG